LWERIDLLALLKSYGTASGRFKVIGSLDQAWFAGFAPGKTSPHGTASPHKSPEISTYRKKVAIAIPKNRYQSLVKSRLPALCVQSMGRQ
jgi:hypothetical protein